MILHFRYLIPKLNLNHNQFLSFRVIFDDAIDQFGEKISILKFFSIKKHSVKWNPNYRTMIP